MKYKMTKSNIHGNNDNESIVSRWEMFLCNFHPVPTPCEIVLHVQIRHLSLHQQRLHANTSFVSLCLFLVAIECVLGTH
ncbi:unnamed protein product [Periconia digitata]|uniref:Uncharacterized protein n=1 Tax=Periconia digitata TaxID=1303443 RepID=A0A9W4UDN5_9PLEO|nr:unnamed protein product [Periconia digitata]